MTAQYENIPVPGFTSPTKTATDPELLYSTRRFTQKGATIAGGQGVLPMGTVLGRVTSTKKWKVYDNNASDGTEVARGILRRAVDTGSAGAPDQLGNIVISGILKLEYISGADSAAITDLNARTDSVLGTFTF
jgi:hypothetical protein